jgi:hypothetical protein
MCNKSDHAIDAVQQMDLVFLTRRYGFYLSGDILSLKFSRLVFVPARRREKRNITLKTDYIEYQSALNYTL